MDKNNAFKQISDQLHGMTDLEAIASYTSGSLTSRPKLRVKKSPVRDSNSDNMIPVLINEKDQFTTLQPSMNGVLVNLQHQLKHDLKRSESLSKSRESIGEGIVVQKHGDNMWDMKMDATTSRENLEAYQPPMVKSSTEKALPIKKQLGMKKKAQKPRPNSKMRLQFIITGDKISDPKHEVDPSLKKRKEII